MTDTEKIIKGIKICGDDKSYCKDCPYYELKSPMCLGTLHEEATDLIRRQQEKINHFVEANKMVVEPKTVETDKTEDEILKKLLTQKVEFIPNNNDIKAIQRNAVVDFADRLKRMMFITDYDIDDLVNKLYGNPEQVKGE